VPNNGLMASVPRPLLALLVATVAAFAIWTVALKPGSSTGGSANSPTAPVYQSAIAKAHQAVAASAKGSAADGAPVTSTAAPAARPKPATATHSSVASPSKVTSLPSTTKAKASSKAKGHPAVSEKSVLAAISAHKVVALLFYNPAAPDDVAVAHELAGVSTDHGQAATFAVPVSQMSQFGAITAKVPIDATPTLTFIDKRGQATSLVGFADRFEIAQRVSQALRAS
jgi:hypothetical protein